MTADGSTDVVLNDRDGFVLLGEQLANPVGIFFRIGMANESEVAVFGMGLPVEGRQLLQPFLATVRCTCQRKLPLVSKLSSGFKSSLEPAKATEAGMRPPR